MISDFPVMMDACVLVQAAVRDTLLRLFERRLFLARWTDEIIEETVRTLRDNLGRTPEQTDHLVNELRNHFPGAWVERGYRELIPAMTNQEKDRHVLAAATQSNEPRASKGRFETETRAKSSFCRRISAAVGTHPRTVSNDVHRGDVHGTSG
jgi:hypothetical protein